MSNTLTAEQKAKIFMMYPNAQVEFDGHIGNVVSYYLSCGDLVKQLWVVSLEDKNFKENELSCSVGIDEAKLLLTSLHNISDEDAIEVGKMVGIWSKEEIDSYEGDTSEINYDLIKYAKMFVSMMGKDFGTGMLDVLGGSIKDMFDAYQYLRQRGYALPEFIEPGHPDNGKTAIEMGIGLEKKAKH